MAVIILLGKLSKTTAADAPVDWRHVYDNIVTMRRERDAPVDVMGCDRLYDTTAAPKVRVLQGCTVIIVITSWLL